MVMGLLSSDTETQRKCSCLLYVCRAKARLQETIGNLNYAMGCTADVLDLRDEKQALQEVYDKITEKYNAYMTRVRNNQ